VRVTGPRGDLPLPGTEGVVEEIAGPNEDGTGWSVTLRLGETGGADSLVLLAEDDLEATGLAEQEDGERVILEDLPSRAQLRDVIELRLVTEITNGIDAARVAATVERELLELIGSARVSIEAERHWSEPFNYELEVTIEPLDDPVLALRELAEAGGDGWLSCRDDGWRCELWWSDSEDDNSMFVVPEVSGAELTFLPWRSPRRRPEAERPLVAVHVPKYVEEPPELDTELDAEPGDEEA
jgi:hypothetical protein